MIVFKTLTANWTTDANEPLWQNSDNDDNDDDVDDKEEQEEEDDNDDVDGGVGASSSDDDDDIAVDDGDDNDDDSDDADDVELECISLLKSKIRAKIRIIRIFRCEKKRCIQKGIIVKCLPEGFSWREREREKRKWTEEKITEVFSVIQACAHSNPP